MQTTTIRDVSGIIHCYVIPNLYSSSEAAYTNSGCQAANRYINLAIPFIKEIINIIEQRILLLRLFDYGYVQTFNDLYNEITFLSNNINSTYDLLNSNKDSSSISNCGSVRYDLIDFCDFIGDTTRYDAKIVVIFSVFMILFCSNGVGCILLCSHLLVTKGRGRSKEEVVTSICLLFSLVAAAKKWVKFLKKFFFVPHSVGRVPGVLRGWGRVAVLVRYEKIILRVALFSYLCSSKTMKK